MIIYIVKPGDSLYNIARQYGVDPQQIARVNDLSSLPYLVVGQALLIPATERAYTVEAGDSVYSIARRFGVSVQSIIRLNRLTPPYQINVGDVLRIPVEEQNYGTIEVNAYIEPTTPQPAAVINEVGRYLTYISPFSYTVNADGSINPIDDAAILAASRRNNIAPLMVITNFAEGNFSTPIAAELLTNDAAQQNLIDNVLQTMEEKGYYGLNIDFERIDPANRQDYNNFLRKVMDAFRPRNIPVSVALAPKTSDVTTGAWYGAHDYGTVGNLVDFVILMTYEWGWSGGPPYAVAPANLVEEVIAYAVTEMPANKIMMGMPLYGYDWRLPFVEGGPFARRISPQEALALAARVGAEVQYNTETSAPFFRYYDQQGVQHEVWFEDARSFRTKLLLVNEYGLRGVSFWLLGEEFPQGWQLMGNMFNIVKF